MTPKFICQISICLISLLFNTTVYPVSKIGSIDIHQKNNIESIKIHKTGDELSDPIIELGGDESITLTFDDLSDNTSNYSYSITHCACDWKESGLVRSEYMDGFDSKSIYDYQNSVATTVPYTHFKVQIPNDEIKIKLSGNYIIRVFDTYSPEKIMVEQRFMVVEPLVAINAMIKQPIDQNLRLTSQQIELKIGTAQLNLTNPYTDLIPVIVQNNQPDNCLFAIKPTFIRTDEIDYSSSEKLIFDGVNEYRSFDINSIRFLSSGIQSIEQFGGNFNVQLKSSENNRNQKYSTQQDINGKYLVKLERSELSDVEADYAWVYFTLPYYDQLPNKEVYVYGELTGWQLAPENMMQYSFQRQAYEVRLLLKQGYYNYRFAIRDTKTGEVDFTFFEGNHFETENSYTILVYYRQIGARYDRLIGVKRLNSNGTR
ncbi:MAG: DUF5103 domain-containing protein [Bacteroidales bacterium]|nr:DUF5103 domain-containing protein [Bacteroidales bacterium]